ncbi:hypothetical protein H310_09226 [Aphanomyces invadans]|uniref:FYVE-type domain-containing protein n=1 Tax=Aphanomyces invadans TaxID=157072 RepID=A0A024TX69_9STRA|nr:hypothetical protein H310_09226 [Aphanomyces invadans]ETV97907.1 hypothetical protein H310_09226 [Aphanomyces invadans]|eukprot:XP_008873468.1 hypothetical protein H310_09226 [Aphanomyces invadans]
MTSVRPQHAAAAAAIKPWQYASTCHACRRPFGLFSSRHHCRNCGHSVCAVHSKYKVELPLLKGPQRVCNQCHMALLACRPKERHVIRRVPAHPLRSQSAALRRYPWETPRETSEVFQWDHESPLDPVASLKQRRWTPADNTTTNSSVARSSSSTASTALQKSMQYYSAPHIVDRGSTPNADSPTASGNGANEEALWRISRTSEMPSRWTAQLNQRAPQLNLDPDDVAIEVAPPCSTFDFTKYSTASSDIMDFVPVRPHASELSRSPPQSVCHTRATSHDTSGLPDVPTMAILIMQKRALEVDVERLQAKLADYRAAAARECRARRRLRRRSKARRGHITAANGYVDQGEYFYAQLELKKALALDDKCWATWHALAECLLKCHWPNEAALACQVSLELARTPVAVALLGRIRLRQQRLSEAIACFHEALE